jgi:hypothetical protein
MRQGRFFWFDRVFWFGLAGFLVFPSWSVHAAALYVTSNAPLNPSASFCPLATPCHPEDATRIAQSNLQDDLIILYSPSTFGDDIDWIYTATGNEANYDLTVTVQGGEGLIDGHGQPVEFLLYTTGTGKLTVDGLKLHNIGNATTYGAALTMLSSGDLAITNTSVLNSQGRTANYPGGSGGVDLRTTANVLISDSRFEDNINGGLYAEATHVEIHDSSISGNVGSGSIFFPSHSGASLLTHTFDIRNSEFLANIGNQYNIAGALELNFKSGVSPGTADSSLFNSRFVNNGSSEAPAALSLVRNGDFISRIEMDRNLFSGNVADDSIGGAIYLDVNNRTRVLLRDNLILGNRSTGQPGYSVNYGAAIYGKISGSGKLWLINNTVVKNEMAASATSSAAVHLYTSNYQAELEVSNNIIYSNPTTQSTFADSDLRIDGDIYAAVNIRNNNLGQFNIYNGASSSFLTVSGTITSTPAFFSPATEDYHLLNNSVLIDAGFSSSQLSSSDMDGQARVQGSRVDIGADEFSGQVRRDLVVTKTGNGTGTVGSAPSGVSCGPPCSLATASFDDGITVQLIALPAPGSEFVEWSGGCSGTQQTTQVVMYAPSSCTARFDLIRYNIGVSITGSESGDITSPNTNLPTFNYPIGGSYQVATGIVPGSAVSFTAAVFNTGNAHAFWQNCSSYGGFTTGQSSSSATCTINNVQSSMILKAQLKYGVVLFPNRNLTVSRLGDGSGTVVSTPTGINCGGGGNCSAGFNAETEVTLQATPDAGSLFAGWGNGCAGNSPSTIVTMNADTFCHAVFDQAYNIDVSISGDASGTLLDYASGIQISYPPTQQFLRRHPMGTSTELRANAPEGVSATFTNCETHPGLGLEISGNGTSQATCALTNPAQDFSFGLSFNHEHHIQTVEAFGTGTGQVTLNPGNTVWASPGVRSTSAVYGTTVTMLATGSGGAKVYWSNCVGPGSSKTGEGTSSSTCIKPLYNTNWVGVEFRAAGEDLIFKNGFE